MLTSSCKLLCTILRNRVNDSKRLTFLILMSVENLLRLFSQEVAKTTLDNQDFSHLTLNSACVGAIYTTVADDQVKPKISIW